MAVYKPYKKTASGKEEVKIPYNVLSNPPDLSVYAKLAGGNTFKGKQTFTEPPTDNPYSIDASGYIKGSWLQAPSTGKAASNTGKVCVLDSAGWVYYRTPAEIVSDGGGATTPHLYEHNIYLYAHKTSGVYFDVYFKVITNSATPITYAMLGTMYKNISISATGHGTILDPEGTTKQFPAIVIRIYHNGTYLLVDSVYDNTTVTPIISNAGVGTYFSSSEVTITDHVGTIL